ncbi:aminopeptidase N-like [Nylanderia fulva]|uniref:aminopeptidase N-like n=1 Tax=Nylanderia fulva TaxID=613905 RepID=UPI0010FB2D62|nr:aminopeptidase N-like [Nylanderia fulva]
MILRYWRSDITFLILLLNSCLISIANFYQLTPSYSKVLIDHNCIIPKHYDIQLDPIVVPNIMKFEGNISIEIEIIQPIQMIKLHALQPYIINTKNFELLINVTNEIENNNESKTFYPILREYQHTTQIMSLYFMEIIPIGIHTLKMRFESMIDNNVEKGSFLHKLLHINKSGNNMLIATRFEAMNARRVIPCWDKPHLRATFQISIKHHKNYTVLSNMQIQMQKPLNEIDMILTTFNVTPAMPTYLVAFMVSTDHLICNHPVFNEENTYIEWQRMYWKFIMGYHVKPDFFDKNPITNDWYTEDLYSADTELKFAQIIAEYVSQLFGIEWSATQFNITKITKLDHIVVPDLQVDSIQNWGIILYRKQDVIYRIDKDPVIHKINVARLVASGIVHQWFGNIVSPSLWSYIWLNDGIATLFGMDAVDKIFPNVRIMDLFVVQTQHESLHLDTNSFMKPLISEINDPSEIDSWSFSRYIKAPAILRMMHMFYDDAFRRGLQRYVNKHALKSATLDDLWTAIQIELPDSPHVSKSPVNIPHIRISQIMGAWTKQMHYPILNVKRNYHNASCVTISAENNLSAEDNWFILVTVTTETELNFVNIYNNYTSYWLILTPQLYPYYEIFLPRMTEGWIIANLQQMGYYRVNYDIKNWQRIASYLNSDQYLNIHVLNRAQIIDDAFHLTIAGKLDSSIFWDLTSYLKQEKDYIAWYPMIKIFEYMSSIFKLPLQKVTEIKVYFSNILSKLLATIGYYDISANINDTTKYLIQEATRWACTFELPECLNIANNELKKQLKYAYGASILYPWWKEWTYCKGMVTADNKTWSATLNLLKKNADDNKIFEYLTCAKDFDIIVQYLSQIKNENDFKKKTFPTIERINIFYSIITKHVKNNKILEHILFNFEVLKPREISTIAALTHIINHVYSKNQLKKISKFVKEYLNRQNSNIHHKLDLRWSQIRNLTNYLLIF